MDETFASTSKAFHLLLFFFVFSHVLHAQTTNADPLYQICEGSNFTASSAYQTNLKRLLSSLASNGEVSGFYNDTVGAVADRVYGLVLCRGDDNSTVCGSCLQTATQDVLQLQLCPYRKRAIIWYDQCLLRYGDLDFFSPTSFNWRDTIIMWNTQNISQAELLDVNPLPMVNELLRTAPNTSLMYNTADMRVGASARRYGMAQCTRDLTSHSCNSCLSHLLDLYPTNFAGRMGWRVLTPNCLIRYEAYPFLSSNVSIASPTSPNSPASQQSPPGIPPQPPVRGHRRKLSTIVILTLVTVAIVVAIFSFLCFYYCILKRRSKSDKSLEEQALYDYQGAPISADFSLEDIHCETSENSSDLPLINLNTILAATNNFSNDNKLGEGGFGPVYKGILPDGGKEVAIKRLSARSRQGQQEFMNEVLLIAKLQHKNLVRLLYCCMEKDEMMLAYEYMPNKSLDAFIFDPSKSVEMDWEKRLDIIGGIARGLLYLHEDSRLTVIHRDLKASNVLLDKKMNPKISDFGMARIFGGNQIQANTNRIVGTYGYMSPEYAMEGLFSVKSDVFSFGVLLLEILSGKRNSGFYFSDLAPSLIQYAWRLWRTGRGLELLDPLVTQQFPTNKVLRCIHIGLLCVQEDAVDRPTMSSVIIMLASESVALPPPKEPAFSVGRNAAALAQSTNGFLCTNKLTISEAGPR